MAPAEKHAWGSLIAMGLIYYYFQMRMLDGWGIVSTTPKDLLGLYIVVVVLSIISESVIAAILANKKLGDIEKDERDIQIEARANGNEHLFLIAAINIFLFHVIADAAFENHILPRYDLTDLSSLVFVLFSVLFAGEAVKRISIIYLYNNHSEG